MKKSLFFLFCIFLLPSLTFALDEPTKGIDYEEYKKNTELYCDSSDREWSTMSRLVPIPQYPKLDADAINNQIRRTESLTTLTSTEKERLGQDLSMDRIGNFSGYKTVEVARLQYRSTMNTLFACSVIESRLDILKNLTDEIARQFPSGNSEIKKKLQTEAKKLEKQSSELQCNATDEMKGQNMQTLKNSATLQYCHYRYYLDYLSANLEYDKSALQMIEQSVGQGNGTVIPETIGQWNQSYQQYAGGIDTEIDRADATLPRVFRAFQEMERYYSIHLLLTIIYDDYIGLRENLSRYMNASTQLYMKAYNAQDSNK